MKAYIYQADIYCEDCGQAIKTELDKAGKTPADPDDEYTFDSDEYPKGPYSDGGGEADSPQHCADCHTFLENPLTSDGREYVRENSRPEWDSFYEIDRAKVSE
jgi:hypothetical protein